MQEHAASVQQRVIRYEKICARIPKVEMCRGNFRTRRVAQDMRTAEESNVARTKDSRQSSFLLDILLDITITLSPLSRNNTSYSFPMQYVS